MNCRRYNIKTQFIQSDFNSPKVSSSLVHEIVELNSKLGTS